MGTTQRPSIVGLVECYDLQQTALEPIIECCVQLAKFAPAVIVSTSRSQGHYILSLMQQILRQRGVNLPIVPGAKLLHFAPDETGYAPEIVPWFREANVLLGMTGSSRIFIESETWWADYGDENLSKEGWVGHYAKSQHQVCKQFVNVLELHPSSTYDLRRDQALSLLVQEVTTRWHNGGHPRKPFPRVWEIEAARRFRSWVPDELRRSVATVRLGPEWWARTGDSWRWPYNIREFLRAFRGGEFDYARAVILNLGSCAGDANGDGELDRVEVLRKLASKLRPEDINPVGWGTMQSPKT